MSKTLHRLQSRRLTYNRRVPSFPVGIPRAEPLDGFIDDPLNFLRQARTAHGNLFVLREPGAFFSRADDCVGVVAVFGRDYQRAVLTNPNSFGMPVSAARRLNLPPNLANLNRGLHSLIGVQHRTHRRSLSALLSECAEHQQPVITAAVDAFIDRWRERSRVEMLHEMRELALTISHNLLFGGATEQAGLVARMRTYFDLRRELSSPARTQGSIQVEQLTTVGNDVDAELRYYIQTCRANSRVSDGIVARLARLEDFGSQLTEDEVIGHANVLFISNTEPVAVTLTWIFLVLSQLPDLRRALREECMGTPAAQYVVPQQRGSLSLLDSVIEETLRVLPPNAFMVRTTTRPVVVGALDLPEKCEILLCPFIYFPFGAGAHSCVGRTLALSAIRAAVSRIVGQCDLVLADEQDVDWRLQIIFMPDPDPVFSIQPVAGAWPVRAGRLRGPVANMLQLDIS